MLHSYYPLGKRGRPTKNIETLFRMYLMRNWFKFFEVAIGDSIYDNYAMQNFMYFDFFTEQVLDFTTLLHFRHFLEKNKISEQIFDEVATRLEKASLIMRGSTIVDATIITALSSTKK